MRANRGKSPLKLRVAKVAAQHQLRKIRGVEGVGIGDGSLRVYVLDEQVGKRLPSEVRGVPVEPVVTGEVFAL